MATFTIIDRDAELSSELLGTTTGDVIENKTRGILRIGRENLVTRDTGTQINLVLGVATVIEPGEDFTLVDTFDYYRVKGRADVQSTALKTQVIVS